MAKRGSKVIVTCPICHKELTKAGLVGHMRFKHERNYQNPDIVSPQPLKATGEHRRKAEFFDQVLEHGSPCCGSFMRSHRQVVARDAGVVETEFFTCDKCGQLWKASLNAKWFIVDDQGKRHEGKGCELTSSIRLEKAPKAGDDCQNSGDVVNLPLSHDEILRNARSFVKVIENSSPCCKSFMRSQRKVMDGVRVETEFFTCDECGNLWKASIDAGWRLTDDNGITHEGKEGGILMGVRLEPA